MVTEKEFEPVYRLERIRQYQQKCNSHVVVGMSADCRPQ
jgi:hypothetical protein